MSVVLPPPGAKTLGRFQLRRLLGKGAQASVWLAYDPRREREVAVKLLAIAADEADLSDTSGTRKGAAGYDICFLHPKASEEFPRAGEGVLIELVQAPPEVVEAFTKLA